MKTLIEGLPTSWLEVLSAYMGSVPLRVRVAVEYQLIERRRSERVRKEQFEVVAWN